MMFFIPIPIGYYCWYSFPIYLFSYLYAPVIHNCYLSGPTDGESNNQLEFRLMPGVRRGDRFTTRIARVGVTVAAVPIC